jgi:hypothetical protein
MTRSIKGFKVDWGDRWRHSAWAERETAPKHMDWFEVSPDLTVKLLHSSSPVEEDCLNPRDRVAGFRVLQLMPSIGPSTAAKILDQVEAESHASHVLYDIRVPRASAEDWPAFAKLFERLRQGKTTWPAEFDLIQEWYAPHLDRIYDDAQLRAADVVN